MNSLIKQSDKDIDPVQILGLHRYTLRTIPHHRRQAFLEAYLKLMMTFHHPDLFTDPAEKQKHEKMLLAISEAVSILSNPIVFEFETEGDQAAERNSTIQLKLKIADLEAELEKVCMLREHDVAEITKLNRALVVHKEQLLKATGTAQVATKIANQAPKVRLVINKVRSVANNGGWPCSLLHGNVDVTGSEFAFKDIHENSPIFEAIRNYNDDGAKQKFEQIFNTRYGGSRKLRLRQGGINEEFRYTTTNKKVKETERKEKRKFSTYKLVGVLSYETLCEFIRKELNYVELFGSPTRLIAGVLRSLDVADWAEFNRLKFYLLDTVNPNSIMVFRFTLGEHVGLKFAWYAGN